MMDILESLKANLEKATKEPAKQPKPGADIRRADIPPAGGCWLITTPRPEYWGKTHGIEFRNGFGLVELDEPEAVFIVHRLQHDFGYTVTALDARLADKKRLEFSRQQRPKLSGIETMMKPGNI